MKTLRQCIYRWPQPSRQYCWRKALGGCQQPWLFHCDQSRYSAGSNQRNVWEVEAILWSVILCKKGAIAIQQVNELWVRVQRMNSSKLWSARSKRVNPHLPSSRSYGRTLVLDVGIAEIGRIHELRSAHACSSNLKPVGTMWLQTSLTWNVRKCP